MNPIDYDYSKVKGNTTLHNQFKKEFEIYACKEFDKIMVIPYDVGFVRAYSNPEIAYKMGMEGVLDTIVLTEKGVIFFDMKTGKARLQKNQMNFCIAVRNILGGHRAFKISSCLEGIQLIQGVLNE